MGVDPPTPPAGFSLIAGHPALDLCNTVDWRLEPENRFERLTSYQAVLAWSRAAGVITAAEATAIASLPQRSDPGRPVAAAPTTTVAEREVIRLRDLRETAYRVVTDRGEAEARALSRMAAEAVRACRLRPAGAAGWDWAEPGPGPATPRRRLLFALLDLLRGPAMGDVRRCADASCGWLYLDTSPRRNRLWCVGADCGNRNRVRRHYQRRRAASTA